MGKLLEAMEEYYRKVGSFPGNDYWEGKFADAYRADKKSSQLEPQVKPANGVNWDDIEALCGSIYDIGHSHGMNPFRELQGEPMQNIDEGWHKYFLEIKSRLSV